MATLLRGKNRGKTVTIHQWANNWFTVDERDLVPGGVVSPGSILLTDEEYERVKADPSNLFMFYEPTARADGYGFRKRRTW